MSAGLDTNSPLRAEGHGLWPRVATTLTPLAGLALVAVGGAKLHADERIARQFAAWGYPDAFLALAGVIEITLGLLLFYGPARRFGAAGMVVWMLGAIATHLRASEMGAAGVAAVLLAFFAAVAAHEVGRYGWRLPRLPAPLDAPSSRVATGMRFAVQIVGVSFLIRWAVGGSVFWCMLPLLALGHARTVGAIHDTARAIDIVLLYLLVLGVGVGSFYGFIGHFFMSDSVAASVGWATGSPFQRELAFYHLGFGISGLLALWLRDDFWLAVGLTCSIFLYGAGWVHLSEFLMHGNTAPRNWGVGVAFGNVLLPTVIIALLALRMRLRRGTSSSDTATLSLRAQGARAVVD